MDNHPQHVNVDISWNALFKVLGLGVAIWVVINLKEIILMLFGVFLFVAMIESSVTRLQKYMSRFLAVLLVYVIGLAVVAVVGAVVIPNLVFQINELASRSIPGLINQSRDMLHAPGNERYLDLVNQAAQNLNGYISTFSSNLLGLTVSIFSNLALIFTALVISFYLLLEEKNAKDALHQILPAHRFQPVYTTISKISERMGQWGRGQLNLMIIIGISNLVLFMILKVPTPLPLAVWAGLCEVLPYIGPFIGLVPAVIVALSGGSLLQALLVLLGSLLLIQQLEAHIVVPRVMSKAVGLSPVIVILALIIGAKLFGLVGAVLAVPVAAVISVIVGEWPHLRPLWESAAEERHEG